MKIFHYFILTVSFSILLSPSSRAEKPDAIPDSVLRDHDRILGRASQAQDNKDRTLRRLTPPTPSPSAPAARTDLGKGVCVPIKAITLTGADHLSSAEQTALIAPRLGHCLTLEDINATVADITQAYVDKGLVTSRAYLPTQNLADGTLEILVVEGKVDAIKLDIGGKPRWGLDTAFPWLEGDVLNLRDIEQGLDQINRLSTIDAKVQLTPGHETGLSTVVVSGQRDKKIVLSSAFSNSGSRGTGDLQGEVDILAEDVLGLLESWSITYGHDVEMDWANRKSQSLRFDFSLPLGYWTARWTSSWFDYQTPVMGTGQRYRVTGNSLSHRAEVERLIYRDAQSKTAGLAYAKIRDNQTFIDGLLIKSASRRLVSVGGQLTHARRLFGGVARGALGIEQGLAVLGARRDGKGLSDDTPRAQYTKLTGELSYQRSFPITKDIIPSWTAQVVGQWSPHTLFSTERITIGGQYSVRGLDEHTFSGDIGGYIRNELSLPVPLTGPNWLGKAIGSPTLFGAVDAGGLYPDAHDAYERGAAVGVAAGVRLQNGFLSGEASVEQALLLPNTVEAEGPIFRFRIGLHW